MKSALSLIALSSLLLVLCFPSQVSAGEGGWHSSGGELFGDTKNPWFVNNTADIKYCVEVDTSSINANPETIRRLIPAAIQYWKSEFSRSIKPAVGGVEIATQTFTEIPCSMTGLSDIQFLFGYGTLNPKMIEHLGEPAKYIGVAVRTDYDKVNLRGKGFVYISSDKGPHSYSTADLRKFALYPEAWKHEQLLFYALLHEMGHVFGLPHTGAGLMSEVFLEQLLNQNIYEAFIKEPVESFFFPNSTVDYCDLLSGPEKIWYGADLDTQCVRLAIQGPGLPMVVYSKLTGSNDWKRIGEFKNLRTNLFDIRNRPAVHLDLPEEQKVFTAAQAGYRSFMTGGMFYEEGVEATYLADGSAIPRPVYFSMTSMSLHATGAVGGQPHTIFNYNSWIATKLYISARPTGF